MVCKKRNAEKFRRITRFLSRWVKRETGEEMFGKER